MILTDEVSVLARNIHFANGVALSGKRPEETIFLSETLSALLKYDLKASV
jgi:hypothetical protein